MAEANGLNYSKLLGFDAVARELADGVDFQDNLVSAKLGAKAGVEAPVAGCVDFRRDAISARLGAKVGGEQT